MSTFGFSSAHYIAKIYTKYWKTYQHLQAASIVALIQCSQWIVQFRNLSFFIWRYL